MTTDAEPFSLMPNTETLLLIVLQQQIRASDADAGVNRLVEIAGGSATPAAWHAAVAEAVAAGLMQDPVRLPPGALQCHWHLELTATGTATVRRLRLRQSADRGDVA
jgi:hypothetical protein